MRLNKTYLALLSVLVIAASKYLYQAIVINPFEIDQEFLALESWKIIKDHKLTLIGAPTSVGGIFVGPLYTYFVALVMLFSNLHPFSVNFLSAIWAILTPLAIYYVAKRSFSQPVGILAALLSSLSLSFNSVSTTPPLVIPLSLVSLLVFFKLSKINKHPKALIFATLFSAIALNLHFTGIYLFILVFIWLTLKQNRLKKNAYLHSLTVLIISLLPLIIFEFRHQFLISKNFISFIFNSNSLNNSTSSSFISSLNLFITMTGELLTNLETNRLLAGLILCFVALFGFLKNKTSPQHQLLALWIIAPIFLNSFYSGNILPYYFNISHATLFIAVSIGLVYLSKSFKPTQILILSLISFLLVSSFQYIKNRRNDFRLQYKMAAFNFISQQADPQSVNLSLTMEHARRGGTDFLRRYYGFDTQLLSSRPTYTIVIPKTYNQIRYDLDFGEIAVVLPI